MRAERGAALLTVLLLVATISLLAVELSGKVRFSTQRTLNRIDNDQSFWYARGGEELARAQLEQAIKQGSQALTTLLAEEEAQFSIDQGEINYRLESLHQCYNLNQLTPEASADNTQPDSSDNNSNEKPDQAEQDKDKELDPEQAKMSDHQLAKARLDKIAQALELDQESTELLRDRVIDWIDSNQEPSGFNGAESDYYSGLEQPYQSADQLLQSDAEIDSLLAEEELPQSLRDQLCVLPGSARLSIDPNQLKPEQAALLSGLLLGKISRDDAQSLIEARPPEGYSDISDFFKESLLNDRKLTSRDKSQFSLDNRFFRARVKVKHYDSYFNLTTLLYWNGNQMTPIYRQYGGEF